MPLHNHFTIKLNPLSKEEPSTSSLIDDLEKEEPLVVSIQEAARMLEELRCFGLENNKPEIIKAMLQIEGTIQQIKFERVKKSRQFTVTNFFSFNE